MAVLEKIRSKTTLLTIVVGAALVLFIISIDDSIFNQVGTLLGLHPGSTVAKVDGNKIDIVEYSERLNQAQEQARNSGRQVDDAQLNAQVLDQMVSELLFKQEAEALGLVVTDEELSDFIFGQGAMMVNNRVQQLSGGQIQSGQELYDMAYNQQGQAMGLDAQQIQQLRQAWAQLEQECSDMLLQQKFQTLFEGTLVASELDARHLYDEGASTYTIAYAMQPYSSLPDDEYTVSDDEIKAEWERTKNEYRITEENRTVSYISVDIVPSDADRKAGLAIVEEGLAQMRDTVGNPIVSNDHFVVTTASAPASSIKDPRLKAFLDSAYVGKVDFAQVGGVEYNLYKLTGKTSGIDKANLDFLVVAAEQRDSILNGLKDGSITFAQAKADQNVVQSQDSLDVELYDPNIDPAFRDIIAAQSTGIFFTPDTAANAQYARIMRINSRSESVPVYEYVVASYTVEPSAQTATQLYADLSKYVTENKTADAFKANAAKAGYNVLEAVITPSSWTLNNLKNSRQGVYWAMKEADRGEVSGVLGGEEVGYYLAVALDNIYDGDFVPYTEPRVHDAIEGRLRNDKKGAALAEKYNGKANDVAGYAALMGAQVDTTSVNFSQYMIPKIGPAESKLIARVVKSAPNAVVAPMPTNNGVVSFVVTGVNADGRPYTFEESAAVFGRSRGAQALSRYLAPILMGRNTVQNNTLNFYQK